MQLTERQLEFWDSIKDLIKTPVVRSMNAFIQHSDVTCLEHCLFVSYISFLICRLFRFNRYAAARGALLHDLFLYDWHVKGCCEGLHGFRHASTALTNACVYFDLCRVEKDIIKKHMWPLNIRFPRYKESFVVCFADKFCTIMEVLGLFRYVQRKIQLSMVRTEMGV